MMKQISRMMLVLALIAWAVPIQAEDLSGYEEMLGHYESIRVALLGDTMDDVTTNAEAIEKRARELAADFDAAAAGVPSEKSANAQGLLPGVADAAARLATATSLEEGRAALFDLSKPMGRYRKLAGIEGTQVVYCSMAKKAWIQPEGEIGNPYMGRMMPKCGEVIAD